MPALGLLISLAILCVIMAEYNEIASRFRDRWYMGNRLRFLS